MPSRHGMTLIELLIVITIVGVIYAMGTFALGKKVPTIGTTTLENLKKNLLAMKHDGIITLVCDKESLNCHVLDNHHEPFASLKLSHLEPVTRYIFDRNGELREMGQTVIPTKDKMREVGFSFTLYPDSTSSQLLLKSGGTFYLYTPTTISSPFVTSSETALHDYYFDENHYPLKSDDYYAAQ